jgi:hypothetical protein
VDGSQISFGFIYDDAADYYVLKIKSRGQEMDLDNPPKMFREGVDYIKSIQDKLYPGWTYRGEYLRVRHHNVLTYNRVPTNYIILFDVNTEDEVYLPRQELEVQAVLLDLECVPVLATGRLTIEDLGKLLETTSVLGGPKIEGVVVKPVIRDYFDKDGKAIFGKLVSKEFKEVHAQTYPGSTTGSRDIIDTLGLKYTSPARWRKAIQHVKESGVELEGSPRDIGKIIITIPDDIKGECEEEIKQQLFDWAWPQLRKKVVMGFPLWYKELNGDTNNE